MGVVNVTPDSFSDGGVHLEPAGAAAAGRRMLDEGAAIIDVGGVARRKATSEPVEIVLGHRPGVNRRARV